MPDIKQNYQTWNEAYGWEKQGEEWSQAWGGSEAQWYFCLYPRIHAFVPIGHILEIAPGYGRWTQYLRRYCDRLSLVDLSEKCIEVCQQRFKDIQHIEYHVNDGKSLNMIADESCDLVFTFDSLVHAESDVLDHYVQEIRKKLTPDGIAFLHHSNLLAYPQLAARAPCTSSHWRAPSVSAALVLDMVRDAGLVCLSQELINWGVSECIDCISVLTMRHSRFVRPIVIHENPCFMAEAENIKKCSSTYIYR